ncbi:hypothetical protein VNO80_10700 [Phaseolus coccineus]|uniref:Uncharacterized protein n=1 Tax=Phaseolus coccineus TaxID=3886 RepID=A0AAN9RE31_PHACN
MAEENMKQNSVKAPNFELVASTTRRKNMSMEYAGLSLDKPICETFPSVNSPEFAFSLISTALSAVIYALVSVPFLLLLCAVRLLTLSLTATSNWLLTTMEKLNGKGIWKGKRERWDHSFETANSVDSGEQDCSNLKVKSTTSNNSCNNRRSGSQVLSQANISASTIDNAFNNDSSSSQTLRNANIGNPNQSSVAIKGSYNNRPNGTQNFDGHEFTMNTKSPD